MNPYTPLRRIIIRLETILMIFRSNKFALEELERREYSRLKGLADAKRMPPSTSPDTVDQAINERRY